MRIFGFISEKYDGIWHVELETHAVNRLYEFCSQLSVKDVLVMTACTTRRLCWSYKWPLRAFGQTSQTKVKSEKCKRELKGLKCVLSKGKLEYYRDKWGDHLDNMKDERPPKKRKKENQRALVYESKQGIHGRRKATEKRMQGFHEYGNPFSESASNYVIYGHCLTEDSTQMTSPKKNSSFIFFAHVRLYRHS